jgi:hypothetical protein
MSHYLEQLLDRQRRDDCAKNDAALSAPRVHAVIDRQTGAVVGRYKNQRAARTKCNKLDLAYGAIRYAVREVVA